MLNLCGVLCCLHACERYDITFVTTNYDRAIELAANGEGVFLEDGFASLVDDEMVNWIGFERETVCPKLVKLHGSTDWFSERDSGEPVKIRHPMALFGRATLVFGGMELGSALVLPSREKLLTRAPYPRLTQAFLNAADECEVAFFVGSSLRDEHIRNAARAIASRAPVFVVNPSGGSRGIDGAVTMAEHASTFLISTRLLHKSWHVVVTQAPAFSVARAWRSSPSSLSLLFIDRIALPAGRMMRPAR